MMYIDTREQGNFPKKVKGAFNGEYKALDAGDYFITKDEGGIVIERSTFSDYIGKIKSGRLQEQVRKCKEVSDDVYFVIENPYTMKFSKMPKSSIVGAMMSLTRQGIKVMVTQNSGDTYHVIRYLYQKYHTDRKVDANETRVKPKHMTGRETALYMLIGINNIGEATAKKLLEGRTLQELINAVNADDSSIPLKYREQLKEILNASHTD